MRLNGLGVDGGGNRWQRSTPRQPAYLPPRAHLSTLNSPLNREDYPELARRVISLEMEELGRLRERVDGGFTRAVELMQACLQSRGKIAVCGVGKSGNIGRKFAATLNSTGATSVNLNAQDALHGDLGVRMRAMWWCC